MSARSCSSIAQFALVLALTIAPARAQGVRIVSAAGNQDFANLFLAVSAAADGDVILAGAGSYGGFTIAGKGLTIVAAPQAAAQGGVSVSGPIVVSGLPAGKTVHLQGLTGRVGMLVVNCQGFVRAQDCTFRAWDGSPGFDDCKGGNGGSSVEFSTSQRLSLSNVTIIGGNGGWVVGGGCLSAPKGGNGGAGLYVGGGSVALHGCTLTGGSGGWVAGQTGCGGKGGMGLVVAGGSAFASGSTYTGGTGEWGPNCGQSGGGGGAMLSANTFLTVVESSAFSGQGGTGTAPPVSGTGTLVVWPQSSRGMDSPSAAVGGAPYPASFTGDAGDEIHLLRSQHLAQTFAPWLNGVLHVRLPLHLTVAPLAVIPTGMGSVQASVPAVQLAPGEAVRVLASQGLFHAGAATVLGTHRFVVALSQDVGPDCDGNGVSDYVDVLFGGAPDENHNLIPDTCPGG